MARMPLGTAAGNKAAKLLFCRAINGILCSMNELLGGTLKLMIRSGFLFSPFCKYLNNVQSVLEAPELFYSVTRLYWCCVRLLQREIKPSGLFASERSPLGICIIKSSLRRRKRRNFHTAELSLRDSLDRSSARRRKWCISLQLILHKIFTVASRLLVGEIVSPAAKALNCTWFMLVNLCCQW